jgi:inhibitor of cysteine peptidase
MTEDKFILMGLDDENSKNIAEVLGNKTCKKILDYLADVKEASEKDIADNISMNLNTVEYNLKKLVKSGLVVSKNFFWSVKGRKIPMYRLAKKHIIIGTKRPSLSSIKNLLPIFLALAVVAILLLGISFFPDESFLEENNSRADLSLKQFGSFSELKEFLKENAQSPYSSEVLENAGSFKASDSAGTRGSGGSSDYSTTNIQVEGVDEADIVKNDGKYLYVVSGNKLVIIDAYPAESMNVLSEISYNTEINEIFINEDRLILFGNEYSDSDSLVYIYDISDRENPYLIHTFEGEGYYEDSRMIGDYVYVISKKYIDTNSPSLPVYVVDGVKEEVGARDIYYFSERDSAYVFTSIMTININSGDFNSEVYLTGDTGNLYVSKNNIYLTYPRWIDADDYAEIYAEDVAFPLLPMIYDEKIRNILDSGEYSKINEINSLIFDYSISLKGDSKAEFDRKLFELTKEFQDFISKQKEKTVIHKINIHHDKIDYGGSGEVFGHILNQFSMDEYEGNLRIATTTGNVWGGSSLNHLYVLNEDLELIGSLEDLAPGESIYSARFLGERVYMVTFKKIDPFYVVDLSNPGNPSVLGYLKIPGYSDYLHIYDENSVIGIGKNTVEASEELESVRGIDFAWYQGVKISLFDVSDVENPLERAKIVIGDRGTDSEALREPRAFLFDREKGILVLPIDLYLINETKEADIRYYGNFVWQGAYVFNIDSEEISIRGRVSHNEEFDSYPDYKNSIRRSLYIDDILYTVSSMKAKASDLTSLEDIEEVKWETSYNIGVL